jgi:nitrile hydratase beta subunit
MKPPHDMGGNPSQPIIPDKPDDPKFEEMWHRRVLGITIAVGAMGAWSIDASRYARESLPRSDYNKFSYYEKWLGGLINLLFQQGLINKNEIQFGHGDSKAPLEWRQKVLSVKNVAAVLAAGAPTRRDGPEPIFSIGQRVCAKLPSDTQSIASGHTRLPHYISGKAGTIIKHHGVHVLPNTNAHFLGEHPENLYAVEFKASVLWEQNPSSSDTVVVDCWESYLDRA